MTWCHAFVHGMVYELVTYTIVWGKRTFWTGTWCLCSSHELPAHIMCTFTAVSQRSHIWFRPSPSNPGCLIWWCLFVAINLFVCKWDGVSFIIFNINNIISFFCESHLNKPLYSAELHIKDSYTSNNLHKSCQKKRDLVQCKYTFSTSKSIVTSTSSPTFTYLRKKKPTDQTNREQNECTVTSVSSPPADL